MNELTVVGEEALYSKVTGILDEARGRVARTVNTAMVEAYWRIGREIVEVEQRGKIEPTTASASSIDSQRVFVPTDSKESALPISERCDSSSSRSPTARVLPTAKV